jgi:DNA-directed RNA polymerase specialized sigma24 family protein
MQQSLARFGENGPSPQHGAPVEALLARMCDGDRDAAAEFITRYGSRVRRRIRGKLAHSMRRIFDSQEILSTVGRRLDLYVRNGRFRASGQDQLWSLVFAIVNSALIEKARVFRSLEQAEAHDGVFARGFLERLERAEREPGRGAESEIDAALRTLHDPMDREILTLWLLGRRHNEIAVEVGMAHAGVRKRWERIKERLRTHFEARDR